MIEKILQDPGLMLQDVETMRDGLMYVDNEDNILFFNKAAEEITGYRREEVLGKCRLLKKSLLQQRLYCAKK